MNHRKKKDKELPFSKKKQTKRLEDPDVVKTCKVKLYNKIVTDYRAGHRRESEEGGRQGEAAADSRPGPPLQI